MSEVKFATLRILHVPCNTAYVRKIQRAENIEIVNGKTLVSGGKVPFEVTYAWILEHQNDTGFLGSFDVCHLHYGFEFEDIETIATVLQFLHQKNKPIVYTCHELKSVHGIPEDQYRQYLKLVFKYANAVITLTNQARNVLVSEWQIPDVVTIHHGFVAMSVQKISDQEVPEILFFGTLRQNREVAATLINATLGLTEYKCRISWVTRPFTVEQLEDSARVRTALELVSHHPQTRIETTLPMTDEEVSARVSKASIMALPYLWAGHSGQLELAYDCGILPVVTNVGFLAGQYELWPQENLSTQDVIEVNWSDGKSWLYQARFLQGLREALRVLPGFRCSINLERRKSFRTNEYKQFLDSHLAVYRQTLSKERNS